MTNQEAGGVAPPVYNQEDPCARHLDALAQSLEEFGIPKGMHQLGSLAILGMAEKLPLLLGGLGEMHTQFPDASMQNLEMARDLLIQMLEGAKAGTVKLSVCDGGLTHAFADFANLGPNLFQQIDPNGLGSHIDAIAKRQTDAVNNKLPIGTRSNPKEILLIAGVQGLRPETIDKINNLVGTGPDWGSIVSLGLGLDEENRWLQTINPFGLESTPNSPVSSSHIIEVTERIRHELIAGAQSPEFETIIPPDEKIWAKKADRKIEFAIGVDGAGRVVGGEFNDQTPHYIFLGPSGSGKSYVMKDIIYNVAANYSPEDVQFMLLDFKEGTEIAPLGPNPRDPTYLPHAKLLGIGVNDDPEFGVATLAWVQDEIERRGKRAKRIGATNLTELRQLDPDGDWPRIILGIDEFQVLVGDKKYTSHVVKQLDDILRRGRSFGFHLMLATQNLKNVQELWGVLEGLMDNLGGRIATPGGSLLDINNHTAATLPKFHAVINMAKGQPGKDQIVHVAAADSEPLAELKRKLYDMRGENDDGPRMFDGEGKPSITSSPTYRKLSPDKPGAPIVLVGDEVSVKGGSAGMALKRERGKNLMVVSSRHLETSRAMMAAADSLAKQTIPGNAEFSIVCVDENLAAAAEHAAKELRAKNQAVKLIKPHEAASYLRDAAATVNDRNKPEYLFVYGADASNKAMEDDSTVEYKFSVSGNDKPAVVDADGKETTKAQKGKLKNFPTYERDVKAGDSLGKDALGNDVRSTITGKVREANNDTGEVIIDQKLPSGHASLRTLLGEGPVNGVHVITSFSSPAQAKEIVTGGFGGSGSPENIGAYITFGVQPTFMSSFNPDESLVSTVEGMDRENRGSFYLRGSGKRARMVLGYEFEGEDEVFQDEEEGF